MNKKTSSISQKNCYRLNYHDTMLTRHMSTKIISWLPHLPREYVAVFIGTDRSTGDALGPIAGSTLTKMKPKHMTIYGTLHHPVHAQNIHEHIDLIHSQHDSPFIIAVDACLGRNHTIGQIITGTGPVQPGAALNKDLPALGDLFVTGVVNMSGYMEHAILQNTRLSVVTDMAERIASILYTVDQHLTYIKRSPAIVLGAPTTEQKHSQSL